MKKRLILFIAFIIFQSQPLFSADPIRVLTQGSSIQTALSINPELLAHITDMNLTSERIKEARALYLPTVDVNFNLSSFNNFSPMIITNNNFSQAPVFLPAQNKDLYYITRISAWQTIYSGGRVSTANKLANINKARSEIENNVIKNRIINNIKTAFNECLYYKEKIKYLKSLPQSAANADSIDIETLNYEKKLLDLFNAIGLELNTIAEISGDFKPIINNIDLEKCLILVYQFKPEIRSAQYGESADELMINLLSMQRYPTVSVGAAQEWGGDQKIINDESNWYVALNISVPIFDGGALFSKIRQGKINIRGTSLKRTQKEDTVKLATYKAYLDYSYYRQKAIEMKLSQKNGRYNAAELELIKNLNNSYYRLEYSVGVELDQH
jgi:outer membrane protein TolC